MIPNDSQDLSAILSSQARFRVLQSLRAFGSAMSLRSLEAVTGLAVRSVQVAVEGLVREKVIRIEGKERHKRYRLDPRHSCADTLAWIFDGISLDAIRRRSRGHTRRAAAVLRLSEDMRELARRKRGRVT